MFLKGQVLAQDHIAALDRLGLALQLGIPPEPGFFPRLAGEFAACPDQADRFCGRLDLGPDYSEVS